MRILALDPGGKKIGVAISDLSGTVARPLTTINHVSRQADAEKIMALVTEHTAEKILVGYPVGETAEVTPMMRHSQKLVETLRALTALPIELYDENFTSSDAQAAMIASGKKRRDRKEQIHMVSAAALLQSYLDALTE